MANNMAEPMPVLATTSHGNLLKLPSMRDGIDSIVANVGPGGDCSNNGDDWSSDNGGSRDAAAMLSPVGDKETEMATSPITNNVERLSVPLPNVPAVQLNNNKQEIRHLPIPQAPQVPMPVGKRHVPVPQLPQAPIQMNKRPPSVTLPIKATILHLPQTHASFAITSTPVLPGNKRHLHVAQAPQAPVPVTRPQAVMNRAPVVNNAINSTANAQSHPAKKSWPVAAPSGEPGNFNQRPWPVQYHHVPLPVSKRHLPVQEAPKGPTSHAYKRERENRSNTISFALKEPPPMHSTANKLKTNRRNVDRAGIEEALLGQERRPMLKNNKTNPYQFVLQDHNYGAPPPLSPPHSPAGPGTPILDGERTPWAPGALYRPRVDDDATSAISSERGREVEPEGEETETAPEGEGDEDAVTRCICDFQHDDGYMVRCDKCFVWQHLDCMGLDRNNPPKPDEEYLCERCKPRPVERHKARTLQMRKREEIADSSSDSSSSPITDDNMPSHANRPNLPGMIPKKRAQSLGSGRRKSEPTNPRKVNNTVASVAKQQQQQHRQRQQAAAASNSKEQHAVQRRASTPGSRKNSQPAREKRVVMRRKSKAASRASEDETSQEDWNRPVDKLRTWIDNYEEAVTNHYSPELRAKVSSIKVNGVHSGVLGLHNVPNLTGKCTVRMIEPGVKVLQSSTHIPANQPVIELRGKHMLATQHKPNPTLPVAPTTNKRSRPYVPFVFFYRLPKDDTEVCVDTRTYGNDARFVRRSCKPNSEVWHCMDKGTLHLYIVSTCVIDKNTEITIAHDKVADPPAHCVCGNPKECTTNPRNNGAHPVAPEPKPEEQKERRKRRGRRTRSTSVGDRVVRAIRERPRERPPMRAAKEAPVVKPPKEVPRARSPVEPPVVVTAPTPPKVRRTLSRERRPLRTPKEVPVAKEAPAPVVVTTTKPVKVVKEKPVSPPPPPPPPPRVPTPRPVTPVEVVTPTRRSSNPRTPVKTVEPEPEEKKSEDSEEKKVEDGKIKTREERKIEAIMKAFERMERESKRKVENQTKQAKRKDTPRKDSTESKKEQEPVLQPPPKPVFNDRPKKRRRKGRGRTNSTTTPTTLPKRRRTRFHSGRSDSDSNDPDVTVDHKMGPPFSSPSVNTAAGLLMALSQQNNGNCYPADKLQTPSPPPGGIPSQFDSGCSSSSSHSSVTPTLSSACLLVAAAVGPLAPGFKFPKTKKGLMNEWLNKSPEFPPTPSPTHPYPNLGSDEGFPYSKSLDTLAQAAIATSPNKENHGSAKKRWLRQVMSQEGDGSGSPNSRTGSPPCPDYVTPLKKRRLARESQSSEQSFTPPTTPTEQRSPNHGNKVNVAKSAEEDDPATSPDEQNEEDEEDPTQKSPSPPKPPLPPPPQNESVRVTRRSANESLRETISSRKIGAKSPSSNPEPRNEPPATRGSGEVVSVTNKAPSLSGPESPPSPRGGEDRGSAMGQLVKLQKEIHEQLTREEQSVDNVEVKLEKSELVTSDLLSETTDHSLHDIKDVLVNEKTISDCLETDRKTVVRTVMGMAKEDCKVEVGSEDNVDGNKRAVNFKVNESFNSAMELDSEMEAIFKNDNEDTSTKKENEDKVVEMKNDLHHTQKEAKIAKRKLSISEYRQRKQLDHPTGPSEPTSLNISPTQRDRSNSSSSSTGSSSSLSDDEPPKPALPLLPELTAFLPPFADPSDEKKGLGEELGNKFIRFDSAPTLVERQRENLMQRLRREFGLFLGDETDASKQPGVVLDPLVDLDEKRRGLPPPAPLDAPLPPRGTYPFQTKTPSTNCNNSTYNHNPVNFISTITGNRPNSTYPGSNRCPPALPNRYSNFAPAVPYTMTGNFQNPAPMIPRDIQMPGGPQNTQTLPFGMSRGGSKQFHTAAAAKAYFPHVNHNLQDRE